MSAVKPLVILDLNGVLVHRVHNRDVTDEMRNDGKLMNEVVRVDKQFQLWRRPHLHEFLDCLLEHFTVAVWTSARQHNAQRMINAALDEVHRRRLLFVWGQEECNHHDDADARGGVRFTKPLVKVWQAYPDYDASNTVLVDDSPHKTVENPPGCHIEPPGGAWKVSVSDDTVLSPDIGELMEILRAWMRSTDLKEA